LHSEINKKKVIIVDRFIEGSPVLILGMHRSGTSLLTRALKDAGLFLGLDIEDATHESNFYIRINDLLLSQAASNWSALHSVDALIKSDDSMNLFTDYYRVLKNGWRYSDYLGVTRYFGRKIGMSSADLWGWKDPRNCLTLPFWLKIYPNLRVINIKRHGADVAMSLLTRNKKMISGSLVNFNRRKWVYNFKYRRSAFPYSVFLNDFSGAIELWNYYQETANATLEKYAVDSYTIQYERFLEQPEEVLSGLLAYIGMNHNPSNLQGIIKSIDVKKKFAYLTSEFAVNEAKKYESLLNKHGYSVDGYA
jgi:hypothetical protein